MGTLRKRWLAAKQHWQTSAYIISFPKSGRTWLRVLIGKALVEEFGEPDSLLLDHHELSRRHRLPHFIYDHDGTAPTEAGSGHKRHYRRKDVLLLVRDPRDVLVSYFFQTTKRSQHFKGSLSEFIRDDRFGIRPLVVFLKSWGAHRTIPRSFRVIRYEDMKRQPRQSLQTVLEFLRITGVRASTIDKAVEFAEFENMQRMERQDYFNSVRLRPATVDDPESFKVRRGEVGGYRDYLNITDIAYIDDVLQREKCPWYGPSAEGNTAAIQTKRPKHSDKRCVA